MSIASRFSRYSVLFVVALVVGLLFRTYQPLTRLSYGHDADLASWIIKDIMIDGHPRLIGQLTTQPGVFIGSLTYYAQIPAYWLANFDPAGTIIWNVIISVASLVSIFWVTYKLYGKKAAVATTFLFAVSFDIARTERVAVPTALVYLWLTWFYYFLNRLVLGYSKSLFGLAVLFALVWHINLALGLLFPLVLLGMAVNWKKLSPKYAIWSLVLGVVLISPLVAFEVKHNFLQTHAVLASGKSAFTWDKLLHTLTYAARNMNDAYWERPDTVSLWLLPTVFIISLVALGFSKTYSKIWLLLIGIWYFIIISFFTVSTINLSEYYIHALSIVWIMTFGIIVTKLNTKIAFGLVGLICLANVSRLVNFVPNHNGYLERKQITAFIAEDAKKHNYPCVAVSYMTDPGNNLGYRYLFYRQKLHVNLPASNSPVYTIVFPQTLANRLDHSFGSIGLVLPDYSRYTQEGIAASCAGSNENVTGSMFGFTK